MRKILEKIYDTLYEEADKVLKEFNPCEHKGDGDNHICLGSTKENPAMWKENSAACCCGGCKFWKINVGCTAEKPLSCKVWLCGAARLKHKEIPHKLDAIAKKAYNLELVGARQDKSFIINNALFFLKQNGIDREEFLIKKAESLGIKI